MLPFGRSHIPFWTPLDVRALDPSASTQRTTALPYPRYLEAQLREVLADTPVVGVIGPRQSGKTTLVKQVGGMGRRYLTLDDPAVLAAAESDPIGFVRGPNAITIDEIQRAPQLMLAIKQSVDDDRRPGRFLLTGSANIITAPRMRESMAGRIELLTLWPVSQAEARQQGPVSFLDRVFADAIHAPLTSRHATERLGAALTELVLAGGYPEVLERNSERRRRDWFRAYVRAVVERDIPDLAIVERGEELPRFLESVVLCNGQLINNTHLGARTGIDRKTADRYLTLLEQLFLVHRLHAWAHSDLKRLVKAPKLHVVDSGLAAAVQGITASRVEKDRTLLGPLLEAFVVCELRKHAGWSDGQYRFSHYRDKDGVEVDVVIEDEQRRLVGIEVKASATVSAADLSGLVRLRNATREFIGGYLLYDGEHILPFGDRLWAVPLTTLWQA